ncbi:MAG: DUF485 domain-containing protein [Magnetococcales bacterium]|nr:DUF485 domain-containing protein [Magnetococcales bacterium]MBF0150176.1 DUF485 domain-containing protein [Magnetococcales bacterium]MBF0173462.1 DUF485 domain-containing protein [Magnetococcales bacterium]MBF0348117.1 DUF485 domain-containing protein [Magnetococcales bacterium]MBF0632597.1 DUF485 domain-containing protein [Magnetococcales bacterium]
MNADPVDKRLIERIQKHPKYRELVTKRSRFAWILSGIMLLIYYAFILLVAFTPKSLGTKISPDSVISVGIPLGVFIIVIAFILTGIYVFRANGEFDELTRQIKEETK